MQYVKVDENIIHANIEGVLTDKDWDDRESKSITFDDIPYHLIQYWFRPNAVWSIIVEEGGTLKEFDNSDFCVPGNIIDHRDGRITVKMGKLTDLEKVLKVTYGVK